MAKKNGNIHPTRIFKTPEDLAKAWQKYKEHLEVEAKKWVKIQYVGKDGDRVTDAFKLPYTMEGFRVFSYNNYGIVTQYFANTDGLYDDFITICAHIRDEIRTNQITGGLLGMYNPSITQRLNNLVEKVEDVTPEKPKKLTVTIKRKNDNLPQE